MSARSALCHYLGVAFVWVGFWAVAFLAVNPAHAGLILNDLQPGDTVSINIDCSQPPQLNADGTVRAAVGCRSITVTFTEEEQLVSNNGTIYEPRCVDEDIPNNGSGLSLTPVQSECYYIENGRVAAANNEEEESAAPTDGLVPCGRPGQEPCQACHVIDLTNNVIGWLVLMLGTIAAIIIVYAGFKLVTAGGNQHAMEDAKSMISNMIIGYVIVLAGWLLIDTGLKALLNEGEYGIWNQVQCVEQPVPVFDEYQYVAIAPTVMNNNCTSLPNGQWDCSEQIDGCISSGGTPVTDPSTQNMIGCNYAGWSGYVPQAEPVYTAGNCTPANFVAAGVPPEQADTFSCIASVESGCNLTADNPNSSAYGVMQVLRGYEGCHDHNMPVCVAAAQAAGFNVSGSLNCSTAFGSGGSITPGMEYLAAACDAASANFDCNVQVAMCLYNNGGFGHWTNGPGHTGQQSCVATYGP